MTDDKNKEFLNKLEKLTPDELKKVDMDTDHFINTFGKSIKSYSEQHKLEYAMLDKTILLCSTDALCIKHANENDNDNNILGCLTAIGTNENLTRLYKDLGKRLKEMGMLNEEG